MSGRHDHVPPHAARRASGRRSSRCRPPRCCRRAWGTRRSAPTSRGSRAPGRTTGRPMRRRGSSSCAATRISRSGRRPRSPTATSIASCSASASASRPRSRRSSTGRPTGSSTTCPPTGCRSWPAATRSQMHVNQLPADWYVALNVNIKPFNQLEAREAVNLAIDRDEIVKLYGGPQMAAPTCQVLPPGFPGYAPYCPWTLGGVAPWSAPDLARARAARRGVGHEGRRGSTSSSPTTPCRRPSASTFRACCSSSDTTRA